MKIIFVLILHLSSIKPFTLALSLTMRRNSSAFLPLIPVFLEWDCREPFPSARLPTSIQFLVKSQQLSKFIRHLHQSFTLSSHINVFLVLPPAVDSFPAVSLSSLTTHYRHTKDPHLPFVCLSRMCGLSVWDVLGCLKSEHPRTSAIGASMKPDVSFSGERVSSACPVDNRPGAELQTSHTS